MQSMPLEKKIMITQARIIEFVQKMKRDGKGAYISFSGGKDSTVLLDIAREIYPDLPAVFSNTGLEYYEIQKFVKAQKNIETVAPKMRFDEVISKYGYPLIGKEVAEAIYYARRIQPEKREKESRRSLSPDIGAQKPQDSIDWRIPVHTHTQRRKRSELCGTRQQSGRAGGEWADWRRGCL